MPGPRQRPRHHSAALRHHTCYHKRSVACRSSGRAGDQNLPPTSFINN
jgi:hypothetical protein